MNKSVLLFLIPLSVLWLSFANAEIYKWVDKNGNVHFGDKAGHNKAEQLDIDEGRVTKSSSGNIDEDELTRDEKRQRLLDVMSEDRVERNKIKEDERRRRNNNKIKCAQLKDRLRHIKSATGLYNLDKEGKRLFLSNKDRNKSQRNLQKRIKRHCR